VEARWVTMAELDALTRAVPFCPDTLALFAGLR
jgi:hypothetical protein